MKSGGSGSHGCQGDHRHRGLDAPARRVVSRLRFRSILGAPLLSPAEEKRDEENYERSTLRTLGTSSLIMSSGVGPKISIFPPGTVIPLVHPPFGMPDPGS